MNEAVIVAAVRTPVGKAPKGMFRTTQPEHLAVTAIRAALDRAPGLDPAEIDDVIMGCAFPEAEQGLNVGRNYALLAGLPVTVPGVTLTRFCASGLQAIAFGAQAIMAGQAEVILAGGIESMSRVPGGGNKQMSSWDMQKDNPGVYAWMGITAENVAERYNVTREEQDIFAAESQRRALAAIENGTFSDEIVPVEVKHRVAGPDGEVLETSSLATTDEGPRAGTTFEGLAKLKPVFKKDGTVTAGNSSQTSDGAAAAVLDECGESLCAWSAAAGPFRGLRLGGLRAGRDGHRSVLRHPQGAEARRPDPRPDRLDRTQRGLRQPVRVLRAGAAYRSGDPQRQRRCHSSGPSPGSDRGQADGHVATRDEAAQEPVRNRQYVRCRRHRLCWGLRTGLDTGGTDTCWHVGPVGPVSRPERCGE